jgi:hypothetical protein
MQEMTNLLQGNDTGCRDKDEKDEYVIEMQRIGDAVNTVMAAACVGCRGA